ncbi:MAG TPA: hypothetical protein VG710_13685, partial [Opitutus sp.]|nr:hypothetical protein [Opitutus sp.]
MMAAKLPVEIGDIAETAAETDFGDAERRFLQQAPGLAEPDLVDECGERLARAAAEKPAERRRRQMREGRDGGEINGTAGMPVDVVADAADAGVRLEAARRMIALAGERAHLPRPREVEQELEQ